MSHQQPTWLAVYTNPQKEGMVHTQLGWQGFETLYLHYETTATHARRSWKVLRAYFPRYVFVKIGEGQSIYEVNHTTGVNAVVNIGGEPLEIPEPVIAELRLRADGTGLLHLTPEETTEARKRYRRGQKVRITEGILEGLEAVIGLDAGHEVKVWMGLFKGRVQVSLPPEAVHPVDGVCPNP